VRPSAAEATAFTHVLGAAATDRLPASFVHVAGFPLALALMTSPVFPMPALGMVHIANRVRQSRSLVFGEPLVFTAWAENLRAHRRGALIDVHVTASVIGTPDEADGPGAGASDAVGDGLETVWHGVSTYLAKGVEAAGEPEESRAEWEYGPLEAAGLHAWKLGPEIGKRYGEVSGDTNPIHTSRIGARLFGFPRPIAHGMYTAARALAEIGEPETGALEWSVAFGKPVVLPARVSLEFARSGESVDYAVVRRKDEDTRVHLSGRIAPLA
ncbi:MAG TPA: hypothetical protein GX743_06410, partial [Actinomycetales bacterium]|nr:hypothetical protein [Actinomycetales bacterium]